MYLPNDERHERRQFADGGRGGGPLRSGVSFAQVPSLVLRAAELSRGARLLYSLLIDYAWQDGKCFPSQATLAGHMRCSDRMIRNYLVELAAAELVLIKRTGLPAKNTYILPRLAGPPEKALHKNLDSRGLRTEADFRSREEVSFRSGSEADFRVRRLSDSDTGDIETSPTPPQAEGRKPTRADVKTTTEPETGTRAEADSQASTLSAPRPTAQLRTRVQQAQAAAACAASEAALPAVPTVARETRGSAPASGAVSSGRTARRTPESQLARQQDRRELEVGMQRSKHFTGPYALCRKCSGRPCCCAKE